MASRCRRYRPRRLQALKDNPELLVIRPSPPSASLNDLQPFNLSTVLMAVHKHCYISLKRTQQGGPRRRETECAMKRILLGLTFCILFAYHVGDVVARDLDGRYADSPLHDWFNHLASGRGLCCSMADGEAVADPDWESKEGHYRVRLDNKWVDVPDEAVITEPNRAGRTMVWPIRFDEQISIRCFMPGSMT